MTDLIGTVWSCLDGVAEVSVNTFRSVHTELALSSGTII
jgi:hypothetical protein